MKMQIVIALIFCVESLKQNAMKKILSILTMICLFAHISHAQLGGMRISAGATIMTNGDSNINPEGTAHTGYHIGADGRLMSGGMSFIVGGRFHSLSEVPTDGFKLTGHESKLLIANGRGGLGFNLITFGPSIRVRSKILASIDIVLNSSGAYTVPGYNINDGWLGLTTGLGADFGPITVDIEYEYGVLNAYFQKKDSTFNTLTFSAGFFF